jgi:hypothetical protein
VRAGRTICEQDEAPRGDQPMSIKAIYPRLAMMLTTAMPPMKRSDLIMASVPLPLPGPIVPKKYGWVPLWVSENSGIGPGGQGTPPLPSGRRHCANPAGREVLEQTVIIFAGFSRFAASGLLDRSVSERREPLMTVS